jgi:hypothetical protein
LGKADHLTCLQGNQAGEPWERTFGSVISKIEERLIVGAEMAHGKKEKQPAWRFTMEQIGRKLAKIYRQPKRLPRRLRAAVTQLGRNGSVRRARKRRGGGNTD